jgi:hypothetical protein
VYNLKTARASCPNLSLWPLRNGLFGVADTDSAYVKVAIITIITVNTVLQFVRDCCPPVVSLLMNPWERGKYEENYDEKSIHEMPTLVLSCSAHDSDYLRGSRTA